MPCSCGGDCEASPYVHFIMTDFGIEKGKTAITDNVIQEVVDQITSKVRA